MPSLPPRLHSLDPCPLLRSAFHISADRVLACATSSCSPLCRSNRWEGRDEPQRGERLRGDGGAEGQPGVVDAHVSVHERKKSREQIQQSATAAFPESVDLPRRLQILPPATSPSTAELSLIVACSIRVGGKGRGSAASYSGAAAQVNTLPPYQPLAARLFYSFVKWVSTPTAPMAPALLALTPPISA